MARKKIKMIVVSLLEVDAIQFTLGLLLIVLLSSLIFLGAGWHSWLESPAKFHSLVAMASVYALSYFSIRRFTFYLGNLSFRLMVPVCLFWLAIGLLILFVFRIQYSVYYIAFSSLLMLVFFSLARYVRNRYHHRTIAYVPLGRVGNLPDIDSITWKQLDDTNPINKKEIDIVMADLRANLPDEWEHFLADCTLQHIPVYHSSRLLEMVSGRVKIDHLYENELGSLLPSKSYQFIKRFVDVALILLSLPLVLPILLITGMLIVIESRGGMFFLQERIGQSGEPFTVYKFRSMCKDSEKSGSQFAKANDMRVTRVGRFIRKTRIDELPQFLNVIKGDMSLIGPRPEQKKFVDEFNQVIPFYNYRHIVKPGISGWAQVVHGYAADTEDTRVKLEHDFYYIKNFSFSMDLLILFKTIQTILTGFGAR